MNGKESLKNQKNKFLYNENYLKTLFRFYSICARDLRNEILFLFFYITRKQFDLLAQFLIHANFAMQNEIFWIFFIVTSEVFDILFDTKIPWLMNL